MSEFGAIATAKASYLEWSAVLAGAVTAAALSFVFLTEMEADQVEFRDAQHGILVWALGAVMGVAILAVGDRKD
jgi:hypothetical protein